MTAQVRETLRQLRANYLANAPEIQRKLSKSRREADLLLASRTNLPEADPAVVFALALYYDALDKLARE